MACDAWGAGMGRSLHWVITGGLLLLGLAVLGFYYAPVSDPTDLKPTVIRQGELRLVDCAQPQRVIREWQSIQLPYWEKQTHTVLKCYRFRTTIAADHLHDENQITKLLIYNMSKLSRISFNEVVLDEIRHSDETVYVNDNRPHEIYLPAALHRPLNEISYEGVTHQPFLHIGTAVVGTASYTAQIYALIQFLFGTMFDGIKMLCLMLGSFFLAFRVLFPRESLIGLAGATMFFWGLYYGLATIIEYPSDYQLPILVIQYALAGFFCFSFTDFTMEIAELPKGPFHMPFRVGMGVLGPLLMLIYNNGEILVFLNTYWLCGLVSYLNFMLFYCALYGNLLEKPEGRLLMMQALVMIVAVTHDYTILIGWMGAVRSYFDAPGLPDLLFENYYLTLYAVMLVVLVKSTIVINHYRAGRLYMQSEAGRVQSALRQSEHRLREVMRKQYDIHNIKLIQMERERLLMEIHDGVGSQLISGMLLAKKEGLPKKTVLEMIQGCIDDVRVIIDCISLAERADALELFKKLLDRQRPRLASLGIALHYQPEIRRKGQSEISDVQCLHASRIIQECVTNAIKHATCNEILVAVRQYKDHLLIVVWDNGGGVAEADLLQFGRGLKNMRKRSRLLGGRIKFQNRAGGFAVTLHFRNRPFEAAA